MYALLKLASSLAFGSHAGVRRAAAGRRPAALCGRGQALLLWLLCPSGNAAGWRRRRRRRRQERPGSSGGGQPRGAACCGGGGSSDGSSSSSGRQPLIAMSRLPQPVLLRLRQLHPRAAAQLPRLRVLAAAAARGGVGGVGGCSSGHLVSGCSLSAIAFLSIAHVENVEGSAEIGDQSEHWGVAVSKPLRVVIRC